MDSAKLQLCDSFTDPNSANSKGVDPANFQSHVNSLLFRTNATDSYLYFLNKNSLRGVTIIFIFWNQLQQHSVVWNVKRYFPPLTVFALTLFLLFCPTLMIGTIQLVLILEKHNTGRSKHTFSNYDFSDKGKTSYPNQPAMNIWKCALNYLCIKSLNNCD